MAQQMTHLCEGCRRKTELYYCDDADEYLCDDCIQSANERAWERHCEDFHDGGSTKFISLQDQQIAARKLK